MVIKQCNYSISSFTLLIYSIKPINVKRCQSKEIWPSTLIPVIIIGMLSIEHSSSTRRMISAMNTLKTCSSPIWNDVMMSVVLSHSIGRLQISGLKIDTREKTSWTLCQISTMVFLLPTTRVDERLVATVKQTFIISSHMMLRIRTMVMIGMVLLNMIIVVLVTILILVPINLWCQSHTMIVMSIRWRTRLAMQKGSTTIVSCRLVLT